MTTSKYEGTIEVVVGPLITYQGKVLLIQSPKWGDRWLLPGGHVEYGESVFESAEREAKEETGLNVKAKYVINFGENIFIKEFHRRAHMMFYHVVCEADSDKLRLDPEEMKTGQWFDPTAALSAPLSKHAKTSIQFLIDGRKLEISTSRGT